MQNIKTKILVVVHLMNIQELTVKHTLIFQNQCKTHIVGSLFLRDKPMLVLLSLDPKEKTLLII